MDVQCAPSVPSCTNCRVARGGGQGLSAAVIPTNSNQGF